MMKVHMVTFYVIDFDGLGGGGVKDTLENTNFPNDCMWPHVVSVKTADCGQWSDDHPLNNRNTVGAEISRLFPAT